MPPADVQVRSNIALRLCFALKRITYLGFVEVCIMHPLDLVKTRFQVQRGPADDPSRYKGLVDCFTKIYRTEG